MTIHPEQLVGAENLVMGEPTVISKTLHPAVVDLLQYFEFGHLPEHLQAVSEPIRELAHQMAAKLEGPQLTHGLMHLLQAKDCFVRAAVPKTAS